MIYQLINNIAYSKSVLMNRCVEMKIDALQENNVSPMLKIPLLGEAVVGKTTLATFLSGGVFKKDYDMTIGVDIFIRFLNLGNHTFKILLWDIAGQRRFSPLRKIFYKGSKGAIFMFDITRPSTFKMLPHWIKDFITNNPNTPFIIVGNKIDLEAQRRVDKEAGAELAKYFGTEYYETSVKTGQGVETAFRSLIRKIAKKYASISI